MHERSTGRQHLSNRFDPKQREGNPRPCHVKRDAGSGALIRSIMSLQPLAALQVPGTVDATVLQLRSHEFKHFSVENFDIRVDEKNVIRIYGLENPVKSCSVGPAGSADQAERMEASILRFAVNQQNRKVQVTNGT